MKLLFVFIVLVIGIGIFVLMGEQETLPEIQNTQLQDTKKESVEFFEPSEEMIQNIIRSALGVKFDASSATHTIVNLDRKDGPELIIGAVQVTAHSSVLPNTGVIQVVSILNLEGEYERIGKIEYQEMLRGVPVLKKVQDIDGDGVQELIMSLMYGGASSVVEGILHVDFSSNELTWVQLQDKDGQKQDAIFVLSATFGYQNYFEIRDIDSDGQKEIIEVFAQTLPGDSGLSCDAVVYKWDGTLFSYNEALSQAALSELGPDCKMQ